MIVSKLPRVGTTIFTVMSSLAAELGAVNLGQGFPDYPMSDTLISLVNKAMQNGFNQYTHMNGLHSLREVLAEKIASLYGTAINSDTQITITPGGTYAIYTALTTLLRPGDEVIVFEPAYDSYIPNIEINGAIPVRIDLRFPDYKIDWDEVRRRITPRTRISPAARATRVIPFAQAISGRAIRIRRAYGMPVARRVGFLRAHLIS